MSTLKIHNDTPLTLLSRDRLERGLKAITSTLHSVREDRNLLTLTFTTTTILLPLTVTMTWGQLKHSLEEKGLIHEPN